MASTRLAALLLQKIHPHIRQRWIIHTHLILSGGDHWWCLHGRGRGPRQRCPSCRPHVWYGNGHGWCYSRSDWSVYRSSTQKPFFFSPSSFRLVSLFQMASITIALCISPSYCVSSVVRPTEGISAILSSCYIAVMEKIQRNVNLFFSSRKGGRSILFTFF